MTKMNANNAEPAMSTRRKMVPALAVLAAVVGGLVVWPASPAAADPVTYENVPCVLEFTTTSFDQERTWTISAEGPSAPVAPGETFTLRDLVVTEHRGLDNHAGELTVLGGQVIDLGLSEHTGAPDFFHEWVVGDVELTAPTELGTHGINPEAMWHRSQGAGESNLGTFCPREGESFPDEPFAFVEVADVDPTPTTTTTVPTNGDGDDNGDGGDPQGETEAEREARTQAELEAQLEAEAEAEALEAELATTAAEAAQLVGATPRFTG